MKYFKVTAKCGHVGKNNYVIVSFACVAKNGRDAAARVREFPRVKHNCKDAIRAVKELNFEEYMKLRAENDADPYLHCKNTQEQNKIPGFEERIQQDEEEKCVKKKQPAVWYIKMMCREKEWLTDMWNYDRNWEGELA